ncbi:hypothetical protein QYF36_005543 [Acer negundo]|nr:hypothetical protein QYF36_005543 [Acer negundo]
MSKESSYKSRSVQNYYHYAFAMLHASLVFLGKKEKESRKSSTQERERQVSWPSKWLKLLAEGRCFYIVKVTNLTEALGQKTCCSRFYAESFKLDKGTRE